MILVVSILASALTIWSLAEMHRIERRIKYRQEWMLSVLQEHEARQALSKVHTTLISPRAEQDFLDRRWIQ